MLICGYLQVLRKLLKFWHNNEDKVLIFSYSISLLKILFTLFQTTEYNVSYLDGSMPLEDRRFPQHNMVVSADRSDYMGRRKGCL